MEEILKLVKADQEASAASRDKTMTRRDPANGED